MHCFCHRGFYLFWYFCFDWLIDWLINWRCCLSFCQVFRYVISGRLPWPDPFRQNRPCFITRSIWKILGPFATASRYVAIHQVSLLSHAACASMSTTTTMTTTTTTTTTRDRGERYTMNTCMYICIGPYSPNPLLCMCACVFLVSFMDVCLDSFSCS